MGDHCEREIQAHEAPAFTHGDAGPDYVWGALFPRLPVLASAESASSLKELMTDWEKHEVVKGDMHEMVHLVQDLFSGFGVQSYILANQILGSALGAWKEKREEVPREVLELARARLYTLSSEVVLLEDDACERTPANNENTFNTTHILEADAMCGVHHWLLKLARGGSLSVDSPLPGLINDDVFVVQYPEKYVRLLRWFLDVAGVSKEEFYRLKQYGDGDHALLAPGLSTFRFLVDYALSVPCGGAFPLGSDANPAYRFASATYGVMPEGKIQLKCVLASACTRPQEAFAALDDVLGTSRDSWSEQQKWIEILEEMYASCPRPIAWARKEALKFKMENYGMFLTMPSPFLPFSIGLPVWAHLSLEKGTPSFAVGEWKPPFSLEEYQSDLKENYIALRFLEDLAKAERAEIKGDLCLLHPRPPDDIP